MSYRLILGAWIVAFSASQTAQCQLVNSEDFEGFSPVPFDISTSPDWTVAAGQEPNVNVVAKSLTYSNGPVQVDGGAQALQVGPALPSGTTNNVVDWNFGLTDSNTVWFSFLLQTSASASTPASVDPTRDFFQIHFSDATAEQAQSLSMVLDNINGTVDHNFRARSGSSGTTTGMTDFSGTALNQPLQTNLIVGRVDKMASDYETVSIYANPATALLPVTPTAMATFDGVDISDLSTMSVRISALEGDDTYWIDSISVGENVRSLGTGIVGVVPEPQTMLLLLAGLGFVCFGRPSH